MASDLVSQAGIFVDWPAFAGYPGGNVKSQRITSVDESDDSDVQTVTAIGVKGAAGDRNIEGGGTLTFEILIEVKPEIPWEYLRMYRVKFSVTIQDEGGERWQWRGCKVANSPRKDDDKGVHTRTVKVTFLRKVPLPTPPVGI